ncbi:hypothetical protein CO057_03965, partial [Candidatus Uhrbacteria bacterium CG_4_9_14_0_2_um_filter_41_50]
FIQDQFRSTMELWWLLASWGLYVYGAVMIGLVFIIDGKHRIIIWLSPVVVAFVLTVFLQYLIRRTRPEVTKTTYNLFVHTFSFPSAHASTSMAFATSLGYAFIGSSLEYGWVFAFIWFLLACLIAMSRVVVGVHYFFDVLIGALIGYLIAYAFFGAMVY